MNIELATISWSRAAMAKAKADFWPPDGGCRGLRSQWLPGRLRRHGRRPPRCAASSFQLSQGKDAYEVPPRMGVDTHVFLERLHLGETSTASYFCDDKLTGSAPGGSVLKYGRLLPVLRSARSGSAASPRPRTWRSPRRWSISPPPDRPLEGDRHAVETIQNPTSRARSCPPENIAALSADFDVEVNMEDRVLSRDELKDKVRGRSAVVSLLTDTIDGEILDAAGPGCKIVANYAVGYNNFDLAAATERGVILTNTPGVLDDATATLTFTLLLAVARRIAEADKFVRDGKWRGWGPLFFIGLDVDGKTLGIAGLGRIGKNVARKARGFDMEIIYNDVQRDAAFEAETGARFVDKAALLGEADFLTLHVPLLPATRHYIGAAELRQMKPTAVLINASRGPVVDEKALVQALREKWIFGGAGCVRGRTRFGARPDRARQCGHRAPYRLGHHRHPPRHGSDRRRQCPEGPERSAAGYLRQPGGAGELGLAAPCRCRRSQSALESVSSHFQVEFGPGAGWGPAAVDDPVDRGNGAAADFAIGTAHIADQLVRLARRSAG